jgi:hypothetical protein
MDRIIDDLNAEIERLTRARDLLMGSGRGRGARVRLGVRRRRRLSAEGRRKISEAMKKRWAERRRAIAARKRA